MAGVRGDGVERAVGADALRLVDVERDRPVRRALPGDQRLDAEIFLGEHFEVVQRARDDGADDHRVDVAAAIAFELEQLVQPDRIFVGGAPRIGGDPPARRDLAALDQREDDVGVAGIDREQHGGALADARQLRAHELTSPAWMMLDRCRPSQAQPQRAVGLDPVERARDRARRRRCGPSSGVPIGCARASQACANGVGLGRAPAASSRAKLAGEQRREGLRRDAGAGSSAAVLRPVDRRRAGEIDPEAGDHPVARPFEQDAGELGAAEHQVVGPFERQRARRARRRRPLRSAPARRPAPAPARADRRRAAGPGSSQRNCRRAIPMPGPGGPRPPSWRQRDQPVAFDRAGDRRAGRALVEPVRSTMRMRLRTATPAALSVSAPSGPISR